MLYEMGLADAYGIAFEFVPHSPDRPNDLAGFHRHPRYGHELEPAGYTDDTQRAVANALVMLDGNPFDALSYARSYVSTFRGDPRKGWSRRFQSLLEGVVAREADDDAAGAALLRAVVRKADSNGSLMGVAVLGHMRDPREVALAASIQAMTTHGVETAPYAQALALVAHHAIHGIDAVDVDDFVADHVSTRTAPSWRGSDPEASSMSARATYAAVRRGIEANDSLSGLLRWAVDRGGDTDSVAASAVAVASSMRRYRKDIPAALEAGFDRAAAGRLRALDERIARSFGNAVTDARS